MNKMDDEIQRNIIWVSRLAILAAVLVIAAALAMLIEVVL